MANLTESYTLTSADESETLKITKDPSGNIMLGLRSGNETSLLPIAEEFAFQFSYVLNRLT
jgi:hypothetical protein